MDPLPPELFDEARLAAVRATGLLDTPPEEAFDRLTRLAAELVDAPLAFVTLVDDRRSFWKSARGVGADAAGTRQVDVEASFCRYVVGDGRPLVVGDARREERTRRNPAVEGMGVLAWAGFPVVGEGGSVLGTLCVADTKPRSWTPRDIAVLEALSAAASNEMRWRASLAAAEREREALAESEGRFQSLADAAPVMIWTADVEGRRDYFNAGWLRFRGRRLDDEAGEAGPRGCTRTTATAASPRGAMPSRPAARTRSRCVSPMPTGATGRWSTPARRAAPRPARSPAGRAPAST